MLFGFSAAFAQATRTKTTENDKAAKSLEDPKLSPEEQALRLVAGEDNPAKIDESAMVDPKIDPNSLPTEEDYGAANAKPAEGHDLDSKLQAEQAPKKQPASPDPYAKPSSAQSQPAGENGGNIPDYRNMSGSKDQPAGEAPGNIPNYREMNGPKEQPIGDNPNK